MAGLSTETDPRALVPGDADQVIEVARRIRVLADQGLRPVIEGLGEGQRRTSDSALDPSRQVQAQRLFWMAQADILDSLATAFERYAVAIRAAQTSAARAAQSAAWARAAFPYPAAWTAYGQGATELRDAQVRLGEAADLLADAVEWATQALPDSDAVARGAVATDWQGLGRAALQVADELAAIVAGGLLAAVGLGDEAGAGAMPATAAALPQIDPAQIDPAQIDPAQIDPAQIDPAQIDPVFTGQLSQVLDVLAQLDQRSVPFTLARPRPTALLVTATAPGQRWEIEFTDAGEVVVLRRDGATSEVCGLTDLWRLTSPQ